MAEPIRHPDGRIEHADVRYEPSDASFGWVLVVMAGAVVVVLILQLGVLAFFNRYQDHLAEINRSPYPLAPRPALALPREPRLEQLDRLSGVKAYEGEEVKLRTLNSYGRTKAEGFIHIPIDRAMQLAVGQNLFKARPEPAWDKRRRSAGLVDAGESNAGRLFQGGSK